MAITLATLVDLITFQIYMFHVKHRDDSIGSSGHRLDVLRLGKAFEFFQATQKSYTWREPCRDRQYERRINGARNDPVEVLAKILGATGENGSVGEYARSLSQENGFPLM
jgi:hypothetical protein